MTTISEAAPATTELRGRGPGMSSARKVALVGGLMYLLTFVASIPQLKLFANIVDHPEAFITGHGIDGQLTKLDWKAVSHGAPTLVFYMARKFAGEIAQALMDAGRPKDEPAAIVANAARADQEVIITSLGKLAAAAESAPALAIIVVGENVKLAKELSWLAPQST